MGLFLCPMCDEQLMSSPHVCNPTVIINRIHKLENEVRLAESKLNNVKNSVFMLLQSLPSLEGDSVSVETEWLRKMWHAAECQWHENKSPDKFLVRWIALHRILCEAFDLFRSNKKETTLEKLRFLKEACDSAKKVLNYEDSKLYLTPEDLMSR